MGEKTSIEWCDSSLNLAMGCDGCELAARGGSGTCYAEVLTNRYGGKSKGYPADFYAPTIFPGRLEKALRWRDLTGTERQEKPWLNGRPRHIFLDDMGDTFTESLPLDWIAPHVPAMAASPHVWMFLTKRPARMAEFWRGYGPVPGNFMLGTSITTSAARLHALVTIRNASLYVSAEPLVAPLDIWRFASRLSLVIIGGESGPRARPTDLAWIRSLIEQARAGGAAPFVKQIGAKPFSGDEGAGVSYDFIRGGNRHWRMDDRQPDSLYVYEIRDRKGGVSGEWPPDIRVREFPELRYEMTRAEWESVLATFEE